MREKYFQHLLHRVLNGKRSVGEALKYIGDNYNGSTRTAIRHQMEANNEQTEAELRLSGLLKDAIKLGYGDDVNFERAFR